MSDVFVAVYVAHDEPADDDRDKSQDAAKAASKHHIVTATRSYNEAAKALCQFMHQKHLPAMKLSSLDTKAHKKARLEDDIGIDWVWRLLGLNDALKAESARGLIESVHGVVHPFICPGDTAYVVRTMHAGWDEYSFFSEFRVHSVAECEEDAYRAATMEAFQHAMDSQSCTVNFFGIDATVDWKTNNERVLESINHQSLEYYTSGVSEFKL